MADANNFYTLPETQGRFHVALYLRPLGFRVHNRAEIDSYIEELSHKMTSRTVQSYITIDQLLSGARFVDFLKVMNGALPHFQIEHYTPDTIMQLGITTSAQFSNDPLLGYLVELFLMLMSAKRSKVLAPGTFSPDLGYHVSPLVEKADVKNEDALGFLNDGFGLKSDPILKMANILNLLRMGVFYKALQDFRKRIETSPIHANSRVTIGQLSDVFITAMDAFKTVPTSYMNIRVMSDVIKKFQIYFMLSPLERQELIHYAPTEWFWTNLNFHLEVYDIRNTILKGIRRLSNAAANITFDVNNIPYIEGTWGNYLTLASDGAAIGQAVGVDLAKLPDSYYYRMAATEFSNMVRECPFIQTVDVEQFMAMYNLRMQKPAGRIYIGAVKAPKSTKEMLAINSTLSKQISVNTDEKNVTDNNRKQLMRMVRHFVQLADHQDTFKTKYSAVSAESIMSAQLLRAASSGSATNSAIVRNGATEDEARVWPVVTQKIDQILESGAALLQPERYYVAIDPKEMLKERIAGLPDVINKVKAVPSLLAHVTRREMLAFAMALSSYDPFTSTFAVRSEALDTETRFVGDMTKHAIMTEGRLLTSDPELAVLLRLVHGANPFTGSNPMYNTDNLRTLPKTSGRVSPVLPATAITGCACQLQVNGVVDNVRIDGMTHLGVEPGTMMAPVLHCVRLYHDFIAAHHVALVSDTFSANHQMFQSMVLSGVMELIAGPTTTLLEPALPVIRLGYDTAYALPLLEMQMGFLECMMKTGINLVLKVDLSTLRTIYYNHIYSTHRKDVRM